MKARLIAPADILNIVSLLQESGYEVLAPFMERGHDTFFQIVTAENRDRILLHFANPYYPPKQFVLPQMERIMTTTREEAGGLDIEPVYAVQKRAILGIRSCDVAGIDHLDRFFLGRDFDDPYYRRHRENLFLVNVVCSDKTLDIGDECFCVCTDTGPAAKDHFDLQLMDLGDRWMVVAGSAAGEALLDAPFFSKVSAQDVARRRALLDDARKSFKRSTTSWFSAAVRYLSQGENLDQAFEEIGNRCLECGACSYVCPSCTCFTVSDRKISSTQAERIRMWDACALYGFTRMAGGHNPRKATHDRRNRRFFRKLAHYFIQRELSMACVGCGRCDVACHGDVGMPSTVEIIRRATDPRRLTQQPEKVPA
jgi:sulfhydrogenase subunit beta (sulfur reductase)